MKRLRRMTSTFTSEEWRVARQRIRHVLPLPLLKRALIHNLVEQIGRNEYRWNRRTSR